MRVDRALARRGQSPGESAASVHTGAQQERAPGGKKGGRGSASGALLVSFALLLALQAAFWLYSSISAPSSHCLSVYLCAPPAPPQGSRHLKTVNGAEWIPATLVLGALLLKYD